MSRVIRKLMPSLGCAALLLSFWQIVAAQQGNQQAILSGQVAHSSTTDPKKLEPVPDALVTILGNFETTQVATDTLGSFRITLSAGTYNVSAFAKGYCKGYVVKVLLISDTKIDIVLRPEKTSGSCDSAKIPSKPQTAARPVPKPTSTPKPAPKKRKSRKTKQANSNN